MNIWSRREGDPSSIDSRSGLLSQIFMSFSPPSNPKESCHIHKFASATTSSTIVGIPSFPWKFPLHAFGQFAQFTCVTSRDPSIPSMPCLSLRSATIRIVSCREGVHKYVLPIMSLRREWEREGNPGQEDWTEMAKREREGVAKGERVVRVIPVGESA